MFAFVVERKNVNGAKSIVYAEDKETKIFEAVLKEGQGFYRQIYIALCGTKLQKFRRLIQMKWLIAPA